MSSLSVMHQQSCDLLDMPPGSVTFLSLIKVNLLQTDRKWWCLYGALILLVSMVTGAVVAADVGAAGSDSAPPAAVRPRAQRPVRSP